MKSLVKIILGICVISIVACQEPSDTIYEGNAILIWTGEYEVDGCGFFIAIDSIKYKPQSESVISPHFKDKDSTNITLQYLKLNYELEYFCGDLPDAQKIEAIKIISIDEN